MLPSGVPHDYSSKSSTHKQRVGSSCEGLPCSVIFEIDHRRAEDQQLRPLQAERPLVRSVARSLRSLRSLLNTAAVSRSSARPHRPSIQTYLNCTEDSRLPQQLAQQSTLPNAARHHGHDHHGSLPQSNGTSLLLSGGDHTRDSATQDLAALTRASSLRSSASIATSMGARHLDTVPLLEQDQGGALVAGPNRRSRILECPFNLLFCDECFADSNYREWILHSLTHFHGVEPPRLNKCCFCERTFASEDGIRSWHERMDHVFLHHRLGHSLSCARPDFQLYRYLWNKRVISDADYRDIKGNSEDRSRHVAAYPTPPVSPNERSIAVVHTANSNSRHDRRRGSGMAR
ncbi:MAG: hypothetical protein Q9219_005984 [cf. Caloplaca sp. 3 TL-2023]